MENETLTKFLTVAKGSSVDLKDVAKRSQLMMWYAKEDSVMKDDLHLRQKFYQTVNVWVEDVQNEEKKKIVRDLERTKIIIDDEPHGKAQKNIETVPEMPESKIHEKVPEKKTYQEVVVDRKLPDEEKKPRTCTLKRLTAVPNTKSVPPIPSYGTKRSYLIMIIIFQTAVVMFFSVGETPNIVSMNAELLERPSFIPPQSEIENSLEDLRIVEGELDQEGLKTECRHSIKLCKTMTDFKENLIVKRTGLMNALTKLCCNISMDMRCPTPDSFVGVLEHPDDVKPPTGRCDIGRFFCMYACKVKELFIRHIDPVSFFKGVVPIMLQSSLTLATLLAALTLYGKQFNIKAKLFVFVKDFLCVTLITGIEALIAAGIVYFSFQSEHGEFVRRVGDENINSFKKFIVDRIMKKLLDGLSH